MNDHETRDATIEKLERVSEHLRRYPLTDARMLIADVIVALRDRPAPPDDLAKLMQDAQNFVTHQDTEYPVDLVAGLLHALTTALAAPVAAPAPETKIHSSSRNASPVRSVDQVQGRSDVRPQAAEDDPPSPGSPQPPVSPAPAPETPANMAEWVASHDSTPMPDVGNRADLYLYVVAAPAPETPAPDAMPEIQVGDDVTANSFPDVYNVSDRELAAYWNTLQRGRVDSIKRVIWRRQEAQP